MRDTAGPDATVYVPQLRGWELGRVVLASEVKLADLRPAALTALGFRDDQLTTSGPRHYRCTLEWAVALHAQGFSGAVWHSRQAVIHHESAVRQGGIAGELLHHVAAEVAVVWTPPAPHGAIAVGVSRGDRRPLLDEQGRPDTLVEELCALLDITLEV